MSVLIDLGPVTTSDVLVCRRLDGSVGIWRLAGPA
jgi:hypothetical protein